MTAGRFVIILFQMVLSARSGSVAVRRAPGRNPSSSSADVSTFTFPLSALLECNRTYFFSPCDQS
jgi:hypothetical protein